MSVKIFWRFAHSALVVLATLNCPGFIGARVASPRDELSPSAGIYDAILFYISSQEDHRLSPMQLLTCTLALTLFAMRTIISGTYISQVLRCQCRLTPSREEGDTSKTRDARVGLAVHPAGVIPYHRIILSIPTSEDFKNFACFPGLPPPSSRIQHYFRGAHALSFAANL